MTFPGDDGLSRARRRGRPSSPFDGGAGAPTFTILSICTGNICRSPMAEQLFRKELASVAAPSGQPLFAFTSAGVQTRDGIPMDEMSAHFAREHGAVPDAHASSKLSEPLASGADVMLTMTRDHLVDAAKRYPATLLRGFTLREFARVLPFVLAEIPLPTVADPAARMRAVVRLAAANRGRVPSTGNVQDDIEDPIGRSEKTHARVADQIDEAVSSIARDLRALAQR
ncbi:hypothetical protein HQQ81_07915 [Microbacteriaceae bacterium VKM Ac-2854]|nr:hypothetical protein [Microbacteriaceae bacterium VKM Ac-2854]